RLGDDVRQEMRRRKSAAGAQPDRHGGIEMPSRDRTERVRSREHREPERERDAEETDTDPGKSRRPYGAAASPAHQPECPQELRGQFLRHHPSFSQREATFHLGLSRSSVPGWRLRYYERIALRSGVVPAPQRVITATASVASASLGSLSPSGDSSDE